MAGKKLKIVIDADIARSAGDKDHPVSSGCRNFLTRILRDGHSMLLCPKLMDEWKKHRSTFSTTWYASMTASRRIMFIEAPQTEIRKKLASLEVNCPEKEKKIKIAEKDVHLIDLVKEYGDFIASCDDQAKEAFQALGELAQLVACLCWLNPVYEQEMLSRFFDNKNQQLNEIQAGIMLPKKS